MNEKQKIPKITTKEKMIFYNFVLSDLISQEKFLTSSVLSWTFSLSKHTIIFQNLFTNAVPFTANEKELDYYN